jgi:uncharacterized protein
MQIEVVTDLARIDAARWNALVDPDAPMLRHEFLHALEATGCVCPDSGWAPCHLVASEDGEPVAAVPMYLKSHSYGEYVFDWAWANAWERAGQPYYPKLLVASPFTPVGGDRILVHPRLEAQGRRDETARAMIRAALEQARELNVSSLHWIFTSDRDTALLEGEGLLRRTGTQFHWHNAPFSDFDGFLAALSSSKRKNIRRERRRVQEAGVRFRFVEGDGLHPDHWDRFHGFYRRTIGRYGAIPYLNLEFFRTLGKRMPAHCLLLFAERDGEDIAGAFFLRGANALYGRYWGTLVDIDGLHFETCYYRPIEYCIERGLARFEAGAQGEHKLQRGLLPATTCSAHWLQDPRFAAAVADFLSREARGIARYDEALRSHSPFRRDPTAVAEREDHG